MNPKLLLGVFLGFKASLLFPLVSVAAVSEPANFQLNQRSGVEVEVTELSQDSQPILIANSDRGNKDRKGGSDRSKDYDNRNSSRTVIRRQPVQVIRQPVRVIQQPVQVIRQPVRVVPVQPRSSVNIRIGL